MFARPRVKKGALLPPPKKRKVQHLIEEFKFDNDARDDYLNGFHKRKLQRVKNAQDQAAKRAREEKIEMRKQVCTMFTYTVACFLRYWNLGLINTCSTYSYVKIASGKSKSTFKMSMHF